MDMVCMDLDKECVQLVMSLESSFRKMYRRLFAMDAGNDFWKKVICEMTIREIYGVMNDPGEILSVVDIRVYNSEIQCLEEYLEEYSQAVPFTVDMVWIQKEYEKELNSPLVRKVEKDRWMNLMYGRLVSTIKLMNLTPWERRTCSDEFFQMIEDMGISRYAHDIVSRYFLIQKFNREIEKLQES